MLYISQIGEVTDRASGVVKPYEGEDAVLGCSDTLYDYDVFIPMTIQDLELFDLLKFRGMSETVYEVYNDRYNFLFGIGQTIFKLSEVLLGSQDNWKIVDDELIVFRGYHYFILNKYGLKLWLEKWSGL